MVSTGVWNRCSWQPTQLCVSPGVSSEFDDEQSLTGELGARTQWRDGSITAYLNGTKVQDDARFGEPRSVYHPFRYGTTPYLQTIWKRQKSTMIGPVFLQDHSNPVRFRNVWVRPLDKHALMYQPASK